MVRFFSTTLFLLLLISCTTLQSQVETKPVHPSTPTSYWQQQVDYTMNIHMDVNTYRYTGKQELIYTNNSPDILHKVFYHLYFNAFQPGSEMDARLQTVPDPDRRMVVNEGTKSHPIYKSRISTLKDDEIGYIKVGRLLQDGVPVNYTIQGTILEVTLKKPIQPGEKATFTMDFTAQIPVQIRRSGRNNKGGVALSMTQWYPKMAEYDFEGWHADPYIAREFYGVWGDFDVTIHIDKKYMLGGTGYLQNPQEVGFGYEDNTKALQLPKTELYTWHFKAPNVHDFTWVADKDFVHDIKTLDNGTHIHFLFKKEAKNKKTWRKMEPIALQTMEFYNKLIGKYPYDQYSIIQGGDGGMEYGMCTLITGNRSFESLTGTMMHEMGHAWFQFALATNESEHPWMDEGFTSFIEVLASDKIMKNKGDFIFENPYKYYTYMVHTGAEEPLTTHSDRYATNMSYGINAYDKGSVFLAQLGYIIGWSNLEKTLKEYYKKWSGKHPSPQDFIHVAEQVSGLSLGWYLNEFIETTHYVDYAVKQVSGQQITLERIGQMPMPVDVTVTYKDGSKENYYIPLNLMLGEKPTQSTILPDWDWGHLTYAFTASKPVSTVTIDTSFLMADVNRENNTLKE